MPAQLASIRAKKYAQQQARVLAEAPDAFSYDDVYEERPAAAAPASRLGLSVLQLPLLQAVLLNLPCLLLLVTSLLC